MMNGSAMMVTFDEVYEDFISYAPNFAEHINEYLRIRKTGLEMISWFVGDDKKLIMDVSEELKHIKKPSNNGEEDHNRLLMFKHIAQYAPSRLDVIRDFRQIDYRERMFTQELMTSGVGYMDRSAEWPFLL